MTQTGPARDWPDAASGRLGATLRDLPPLGTLEPMWKDLERRARASFFLSWHWMGTWLNWLPAEVELQMLQVEHGGVVVGLAFLARRVLRRHHLLWSRALFLNRSGDASLDEISIEHNGILAVQGSEAEVTRAGVRHLIDREKRWDELFLDAVGDPSALARARFDGARVHVVREGPARNVDLGAVRAANGRFADLLGRNTRYQVRRSLRELEGIGPVRLDEAHDRGEARAYLARLAELHQGYWHARGMPGSFAKPAFGRFHEQLIEREFDSGVLQLLRLTAGGRELGYLYNHLYGGRVHSYQSGFSYPDESAPQHYRPGLVAHALAIEHNAERGHAVYDFLAGDSDFKRRLATGFEPLAWMVVQRPRLKLRLENVARRARRTIDGVA
jgi:CelD/BcsL family acetyltransferase involved in cellulose biosynthesis